MGYWLVDRRPGSADDAVPALILLMSWWYIKMASREIIIIWILYLTIWPYCIQNNIYSPSGKFDEQAKLSKLVDECRRYSKPKQCHFQVWLKRPIFGVHDSQGSVETLVTRGGIINHHLIAYSFSNTSAKNYENRLMCINTRPLSNGFRMQLLGSFLASVVSLT